MTGKLLAAAAAAVAAIGMAPAANADPMADLMGMLPGGYDQGVCQPAGPSSVVRPAAIATVDCGPNSLPGGPSHARYVLYPDNDTLIDEYNGALNMSGFSHVPCPGYPDAQPVKLVDSGTGKARAFAACGVAEDPRFDQPGQGDPAIIIANLTDHTFADIHSADVNIVDVKGLWDWMSASKALI
jgi:hypothetical protein